MAGDVYAGYRLWTADWEPGYIKETKERVGRLNIFRTLLNIGSGRTSYATIPTATHSAGGIYSGPFITYITDDKKWSFGTLLFFGNSDVQNVSYTELYQKIPTATDQSIVDYTVNTGFNIRPKRHDFDLTANYAVTERFKIFAGIKSQGYEYESDAVASAGASYYDPALLANPILMLYTNAHHQSSEESYSGPVLGFAYAIPLSASGAVTISLGLFDAKGTSETSEVTVSYLAPTYPAVNIYSLELLGNGYSDNITFKGLTYEIGYSTRVTEKVLLQFGLRGQRSTLAYEPNGAQFNFTLNSSGMLFEILPYLDKSTVQDVFQGLSMGVAYKL